MATPNTAGLFAHNPTESVRGKDIRNEVEYIANCLIHHPNSAERSHPIVIRKLQRWLAK